MTDPWGEGRPSLYVLPYAERSLKATERALLGALLLDHSTIGRVAALAVDDLHYEAHRGLLRLLRRLHASGEAWDLTLVVERIRTDPAESDACGDVGDILSMPDECPATDMLVSYMEAIQDAAARNRLRRLGTQASERLIRVSGDPKADYAHEVDQLIADLRGALPARTRGSDQRGPEDAVWRTLAMTEKGKPKASLSNLYRVLRDDSRWQSLRLNLLGRAVECDGAALKGSGWREKEAQFTAEVATWLSDHYEIEAGAVLIDHAALAAAQARAYHPVREYLDGLVWDGVPRIRRILTDLLHCPDSRLHQAYLRRFMVGAVRRVEHPGVKMDTALIFYGLQGAKKSTFFETLFGKRWFADSPIEIGSKDAFIQLGAVWCYEAAEMESLNRKTVDAIKQFLSGSNDLYRGVFEKQAHQHPRSSVMVGSTNKQEFLTDETGARRFWVITIPTGTTIDLAQTSAWRDQLWAEAVVYARRPFDEEPHWFSYEEESSLDRREDVEQYQEEHPWTTQVRSFLATPRGSRSFQSHDLFEFMKIEVIHRTKGNERILGSILRALGYDSRRDRQADGSRPRMWVKVDPVQQPTIPAYEEDPGW